MKTMSNHVDSLSEVYNALLPLMDWHLWVAPGFFVLLGIFSGVVVEKLLLGTIRKILSHLSVDLNQQIESTLRGVIMWIFCLWGIHAATYSLHFLELNTLENIRKIIFMLAMLLAIQIIAKVCVALTRFYLVRASSQTLPGTSIFENIVRIVIFLLGFIMILQTMGISVMPLITALGVGGLAISLSLQDTLANLFAGINMLLARQIQAGDMVVLESGLSGRVQDIGWRTTTLRQLSNNLVILPNSKLASNIIQNLTQPHPDLTVTVSIPISPDNDLEKLELMAVGVAEEVGKRLIAAKNPNRGASSKPIKFTPIVRFPSYGESSINMDILLPFPSIMDGGQVKHELMKAMHARLRQEGIQAPFSYRVLHLSASALSDGNGRLAALPVAESPLTPAVLPES